MIFIAVVYAGLYHVGVQQDPKGRAGRP